MLLLLPYTEYLRRIVEPRNVADIVFVFLLVYGVLKLLRGTRAAPMAAGIAVLVFFYWLSENKISPHWSSFLAMDSSTLASRS